MGDIGKRVCPQSLERLHDIAVDVVAARRAAVKGRAVVFVFDEVLPHNQVIAAELTDEPQQLAEYLGIVLRLEAEQDLNIVSVFLRERTDALCVVRRFFGIHAEGAVVIGREKLRTVVGKSEDFHSRLDRRFDVFSVAALCVAAAECVGV